MIDARRWVLAETWLSLGLRLEWMGDWEAERVPSQDWQNDPDERVDFVYDGRGVWRVRGQGPRSLFGARPLAPQLSVDTMRHELAHYLAATDEDRGKRNFGLGPDDVETEERVIKAEQIVDALMTACGRIAGLALAGGRR